MKASDNSDQVLRAIELYDIRIDNAIAQVANDTAMHLNTMVKKRVSRYRPFYERDSSGNMGSELKTWKNAKGKKSNRVYTKATPGEPPMIRSGLLRRSIRPNVTKVKSKHYEVFIGAYTKYSRILEMGFPNGARYPYLLPTVQEFRRTGYLRNALRRAIKGKGV